MTIDNATNKTLSDDWKVAKETASKTLVMQQITKGIKNRLDYANSEGGALAKTLEAQRALDDLNSILINSLKHKVDYWKLITPIFIPPQEPAIVPVVLLSKPEISIPNISQMPSYYTQRPIEPVIDSLPISELPPIKEAKVEDDIRKIFSFIKRNKKACVCLAVILVVFTLLSR